MAHAFREQSLFAAAKRGLFILKNLLVSPFLLI